MRMEKIIRMRKIKRKPKEETWNKMKKKLNKKGIKNREIIKIYLLFFRL